MKMNTNEGDESRSRTRVCCELKNAYLELWAFIAHYSSGVICFKIELFSLKKNKKTKNKNYAAKIDTALWKNLSLLSLMTVQLYLSPCSL